MDSSEAKRVDFTESLQLRDIGAPVLQAIQQRFIDAIGCALAGYHEPPSVIARRMAAQVDHEGKRRKLINIFSGLRVLRALRGE